MLVVVIGGDVGRRPQSVAPVVLGGESGLHPLVEELVVVEVDLQTAVLLAGEVALEVGRVDPAGSITASTVVSS